MRSKNLVSTSFGLLLVALLIMGLIGCGAASVPATSPLSLDAPATIALSAYDQQALTELEKTIADPWEIPLPFNRYGAYMSLLFYATKGETIPVTISSDHYMSWVGAEAIVLQDSIYGGIGAVAESGQQLHTSGGWFKQLELRKSGEEWFLTFQLCPDESGYFQLGLVNRDTKQSHYCRISATIMSRATVVPTRPESAPPLSTTPTYTCPECGLTYSTQEELAEHWNEYHAPPAPEVTPAYATEGGAINAVILHLADLTGLTGNDYVFYCNTLSDVYDWSAYRTYDIWSVQGSFYIKELGREYLGTWRIDGKGNITPSDAKAQELEKAYPLFVEPDSAQPVEPTPTPSPTATEYKELRSLDYVGITPPRGEPYRLYETLLRIRWNTDWSSLYKAGEFDCSEMSGYLEAYLEDNGFDTYILIAEVTGRDWYWALEIEFAKLIGLHKGNKAYHAWVAVNIKGEYMAIEATIPCDSQYYGNYKYQSIYTTVGEAEREYPGEFDYWNSPQYKVIEADLSR